MRTVAMGLVLVAAGVASAAEPPVVVQPPPLEALLPLGVYRTTSAYDVWQNLAVDARGRFRARVIYLPGGTAFYRYNGEPYPYTTTRQMIFMPYAD